MTRHAASRLPTPKNKADQMVIHEIRTELIKEHGDKVSPEVRSRIESAISSVEEKVKGDDKDALERAMTELENASMELGKVVYEEAAKQQPGAAPEGGDTGDTGDTGGADSNGNGSDDVVDAEFEVKDD